MADAREQHRRDPSTDPVPAAQHYFTAQPEVPSALRRVPLVLPDTRFDLETDRGVFSPNRIDAGTKLLLLEDPLRDALATGGPGQGPAPRTFVDLGCGYGAIALTLARRHPDATIWAVDVNERALALCRANAAALGLANVVVGREDELPAAGAVGTVSAVYSNPPIRVGKAALRDLLDHWAERLAPGGSLLLVVRRDLGAESLEHWLAERGWAPTRLAARAGYRVLHAWAMPRGGVVTPTDRSSDETARTASGEESRRTLSSTELKRLHRGWRRRTVGRLALLLDGVQNPFNLGSIARTAAAMRVERVWSAGPPVDVRNPKVQKTAMGTDRMLRWDAHPRIGAALDAAREDGYRLIGVELGTGSVPLFQLTLTGDVCLVVGHEERGLSRTALAGCDRVGFVPLLGRVGSLNVATAAALALYEVRRQEWTTPEPDG